MNEFGYVDDKKIPVNTELYKEAKRKYEQLCKPEPTVDKPVKTKPVRHTRKTKTK